ncbi:MAG: 23S rRNA (guanosine(2251)-2'-O)-methyltransferase RlmB [Erysipelotrichia bacterium]|nr:23S rRNA (guanosine(2251)-2'-O)-methyltransferase RlmB [Erysipelotrichia bacterium]
MAQLVYGKNVVRQILTDEQGQAEQIYLVSHDVQIEDLARKKRIPVRMVDRRALDKMTRSDHHQGIAAEIKDYRTYSIAELTAAKKGTYGLLILLDELEDPHNLGAILRTADACGADGVIFKKDRAVGLTPAVAKVSAGAIDTVKCAAVTNLSRTIEELKKEGWWVVGTAMDGEDYRSLKYDFNTVLVIGNEGKGISRLVREKCDYVVTLPMRGKIQSLNASVSAGILMYEVSSHHF